MKRINIFKRAAVSILAVSILFSAGGKIYAAGADGIEYSSRFLELIFGKQTDVAKEAVMLCPGGDVFGIKINGVGVTVTQVVSEAAAKSFRTDDKILKIDGREISSAAEVREALEEACTETVDVEILRDGKSISLTVKKSDTDGAFHLGVLLSDDCSGIGTVTYYDPSLNILGGLGHSISSDYGKSAVKMTRGTITGVIMAGARRGEAGKPGELRGVLTDKICGQVLQNTECGIFANVKEGTLADLTAREPIPIAEKNEIREGAATVISTVKSGRRAEFSIEIHDIDRTENGSKCFKVHITDDTLIALTGGIVRGMSGSPIIQDGKLVGAVTHVLINDPTTGYGIFIENMLNAAQMPQQRAA